ncbi:restriction endonuclease subunit S [Aurantiacibacter aquimixticola]|uniref:Restriction endonuclease subunit S n=1 Tax=Aurantiacibacter aquimixticola TaxID=1958945 RepID=A0A419RU52_9SPHN|nr:restriction endonuclease subunit S [Aurantiacibacter aquimixticola]RJY09317.1 restriction endonuclease subunit S [Aurantiacibacter aquimixticola]
MSLTQPFYLEADEAPKLPHGWKYLATEDATEKLKPGKLFDKKSSQASGRVPVLSQGQTDFVGYHDEEPGVQATQGRPVVTFANHTCAMRFMTSPFSCIQNIFPKVGKPGIIDTRYFFYAALGRVSLSDYKGHHPLFRQALIPVPPLETQQRIAAILGTYDDLIEVNRRRIAALEEMARRLFEEWFVRFRFPGHEDVPIVGAPDGPLPEGWEWVNLYDAAEVGFGFAFKSKAFSTEPVGARVVRIRDVQEGRTSTWTPEEFADRYCVRNGDILVGMDGNFHTNVWVGGDAALNQRVTRLRPTLARSSGWLLQAVKPKIKFFEDTISGTTVAHLGAKHLKTIYLPVADDETQRQADAFFSPVDEELVNLHVANEKLAASRDLLLPRLISGQLSVEIAERELEDAA